LAEQKKTQSSKKSTAAASKKTSATKKTTAVSGKPVKASGGRMTKKEQERLMLRRRYMWVIGMLLISLITLFAAFGAKGFIMQPIGKLLRGFFGIGSYTVPFACIGISVLLLFAKEEKVTGKIVAAALFPVTLGSMEHLVFSTLEFKSHFITGLYSSGTILQSGGLISGGISLLLSAAISKVGAILVIALAIVGATAYLCGVRMQDLFDLILDKKDAYDERKNRPEEEIEGEYAELETEDSSEDDFDDAEVYYPAPKPAPVIVKHEYHPAVEPTPEPEPKRIPYEPYDEYREVRKRIDIPLSPMADSADTLTSGEKEVPVSRIIAAPGTKISDLEPSVAKFNFLDQRNYRAEDVDHEAAIDLTPIPRKKQEPYADLPFDLDDVPSADDSQLRAESQLDMVFASEEEKTLSETVELPTDAESVPTSESNIPAAEELPKPVENRLPEQKKETSIDVEVRDTHQEKEASLGEKALKTVQKGIAYPFPPIDFLSDAKYNASDDATEELRSRSQKLNDTLQSFGIEAKIINVTRGPSVTRYEMQLDRGVKISRLTSLQDDIALALGASSVRIAPIPDKSAVGIEVPNKVVQTVYIRDVLTSREMANMKSKIAFAIGKDIAGACIVGDIGKMPHMLIAGTTGSGKSVCINSIIVSILYRATPEEVKMIMIDPKMVELGNYNGIPHLLIPVVTDYKKASGALNWAVVEMERRYKLLSENGVKDLASYNKIAEANGDMKMPQIVIIIDELADLMMTAAKEVEESICRIAQKARAAGMHLIIATQRPSADVLTGLMKSNIPSRIAFTVSSQIESRIILDTGGAEKLIGRGDMLYSPIGIGKPVRVQGCFLSSEEIDRVVEFIKASGTAEYSQEILDHIENSVQEEKGGKGDPFDDEADEMFFEAVDVVMDTQQASASMLQRKLKLGYARAARIIDQMEERGIIGGYEGSKPRTILISKTDWQEMRLRQMD